MTSLPIDVINVICGWTTQEDVDWYPQFDVKTEKLKWKVNKYSKKFRAMGAKLASRICVELRSNVVFSDHVVRGIGRLFILGVSQYGFQRGYFQMQQTDSLNEEMYQGVVMLSNSEMSIRFRPSLVHAPPLFLNTTSLDNVWSLTLNNAHSPADMSFSVHADYY